MIVFRSFSLAASLAFASTAALAAQPPGITLESILSAPFPSEILASPTGARLAWVQNDRGVRNVWVAEPPEYKGRQVTGYDKDDGQAIGDLEWTPDGKAIFYVRGGGPNGQGETPNPTSDPASAEQVVWRASLEGSEPVRIGPGSSPAVSPRGDGVAFVRKRQVFWAPLDGSDGSKEATALIQTRGGSSSLRWSPDGSKLAFVSHRGNHGFVGVYDLAAKEVRWLGPGIDDDGQPAWSPDGSRVAFLRIPAQKVFPLFTPNRTAEPWSILVGDAATGKVKTVWRAREGAGSAFHEMEAANTILWGDGDRLVFPWEGDGWLHLYSVPAAGGEATLLTPGDFEIESVVLSPDRREILFSSNQGDIDRRHLWRVPVGGGAGGHPAAVTRGGGLEWMPALTSDGKALAYIQAGARSPARAVVRIGTAEARDLAPGSIPAEFPEDRLVAPEQVIYSSADGLKIHAQLFRPAGLKPGERRPALIFLHGGSHRQMLLGWHNSPYYNKAYGMNQYLASQGYVVLAINFRAGIGYGLDFREALNIGASGASEFNDVLGAGLYLRSRPEVDPDRIGLWGGSYGGFLTALGLARASHLFAAGVDLHGVHDWRVGSRTFIPDYDPGEEADRLAFESSPMAWLDSWRSPVLLIHGDDDRNVAFNETVDLAEGLRKRKVEVEILVIPDEVHSFLRHASWLAAYHAAADFFDRKLRGQTR